MGTPAFAAVWLLPAVLPICLYVAWSDLAAMKIPNRAVGALVVVFLLVGPLVLPFEDWLWRWTHLAVMLAAGIALNAAGAMGAGDAKFIAAAAPFVARDDAGLLIVILAGCFMAGYVTHRIARATRLRMLAPDWASWTAGKRFPMGYPLAATLVFYLALAIARG